VTSTASRVSLAATLHHAQAERGLKVIFDTPPIGAVSDATLLAEMVDGVVLVVEAGRSGYPDLLRAVDTIGRERVLGVVLNRLKHISGGNYSYSNYYGRPKAPKT